MRRVLLLLPLLVVPPSLVAAYFLYLVPARVQATETVGTPEANGQAARTAFERTSRLLTQARAGNGQEKELLQQAVIEYRVCLAYEAGTAGISLFDDARRNLAASRLLLVQHDRHPVADQPKETRMVRATPPPAPVQHSPIKRAKAKPEPSSRQITATSREPEAESRFAASGKPLAREAPADQRPEPTRPVVGPDGVTYEQVGRSQGTPPR